MIEINRVWKEYVIDEDNIFIALKDITVTIKEKEFASIIGPSGSGKSTLMHMIGLLDKPSKGVIKINGEDISKFSDDRISNLRSEFVGFIFQQFNLINKLTILENIMLPTIYSRKKLGYDPKTKAMELIGKFGLAGKEFSFPNKLSGGQQQRVAIARALMMDPQLILADEPTGNLDSKSGAIILSILEELNRKEKRTVLIVTHDPSIAEKTKRKIMIKDGQIVKSL